MVFGFCAILCIAIWFLALFRLQEARLEVLIKILQQREDTHTDLNNKRLDHIWLVQLLARKMRF